MFDKRKKKTALFTGSLIAVIAVVAFLNLLERRYCMNVPIISENALKEYTEITTLDISQLCFNEEMVAIDWPGNTIYISQSPEKLTKYYMLQGKLESGNPEYSLYFLDTSAMDHIAASVQNGDPFTLIIKCGTSFQRVDVVITTLPILYLDLEGSHEDEQGRNVMNGNLTLWNSGYPTSESYQTMTSSVEWRMRGNSTRIYPKLSWKVNLRDADGNNNDLDLLGLGSDDDWILNPMSMDDTYMKEKLTQELWNQLAAETSYNFKMSSGEYVELFINGAYQGLYLLQRRIDTKYLELDRKTDILMKGINTWEAETSYDAYEVVSTPLDDEETYAQLDKALSFTGNNHINIDNFIDVSLLLQFLSGVDNYGYKNMFYALRENSDTYELYFVPWDTDLSLGVTWGYAYEESMNEIIERYELATVRENVSDIDEQIAKRWMELRNSIYTEENITFIYEELTKTLTASGALQRDEEKWGLLHEGEDNWENLQKFISERLTFLDEYYADVTQNN